MNVRISEAIKDKAKDSRIACSDARAIAEQLNVSYKEVGTVADKMKIKITDCELGCF